MMNEDENETYHTFCVEQSSQTNVDNSFVCLLANESAANVCFYKALTTESTCQIMLLT